MVVQRFRQQSLADVLGTEKALRACLPTCFYMLARAHHYLGPDTDLVEFCRKLNWDAHFRPQGWLRAGLSQELRERYGMRVVSWQLGGIQELTDERRLKMKDSGYVVTPAEAMFFRQNVEGHDLFDIVRRGYPVIVTVNPGFGKNRWVHAVILNGYKDGLVGVIDPDDRSSCTQLSVEKIKESLSPSGAATVVLPPL